MALRAKRSPARQAQLRERRVQRRRARFIRESNGAMRHGDNKRRRGRRRRGNSAPQLRGLSIYGPGASALIHPGRVHRPGARSWVGIVGEPYSRRRDQLQFRGRRQDPDRPAKRRRHPRGKKR